MKDLYFIDTTLRDVHQCLWATRVTTPLNALVRSKSFISFDLMPDDVIELWVKRLAANGIRRITMFDGPHDLCNLEPTVRAAKAEVRRQLPTLRKGVAPAGSRRSC